MQIKVLDSQEVVEALKLSLSKRKGNSTQNEYLAMYSSWMGGIITDPALMMIPIDDHMVHRGDGVFEVFRGYSGKLVEIEAHLERLQFSADSIGLSLPFTHENIISICTELMALVAVKEEVLFRLFVSRGPGNFTPNPYETEGSQLYIVMTRFRAPASILYERGVKAGISQIQAKPIPYCQIKSCNYLPNVLMKKEAIDRGLDYTIGFTQEGDLTEGPTENIMIVNAKGEVWAPLCQYTLKGTTLNRIMLLLQEEIQEGHQLIKRAGYSQIKLEDVERAKEILLAGTTLGVLPVTYWEGKSVGSGKPGPVFHCLYTLLKDFNKDLAICSN